MTADDTLRVEIIDSPFAKRIIGFSGFARVGKDSAANVLVERYGFTRMAFADELKKDLMEFLKKHVHTAEEAEALKNIPKEVLRPLMVGYGAVMRAVNPDYWIHRLEMTETFRLCERIVLSDCRYRNEIDWIETTGGRVFRIHRPGYFAANEEEERSFKEIDAEGPFPSLGNVGTLPEFEAQVVRMVGLVCPWIRGGV